MRDRLLKGVLGTIPHAKLNGHPEKRLAGNFNVSFDFIEGESMLLWLDDEGICASTGSACTFGVVVAIPCSACLRNAGGNSPWLAQTDTW